MRTSDSARSIPSNVFESKSASLPLTRSNSTNGLGKFFVGEEPHLRGNWIGFVFVSQVAGVSQAGEHVLSSQSGIACHEIVLRLARGEKLEYEFDCQTRTSDHGFASQNLGVDSYTVRERPNL